jgi:23S rRNA (uracil1939-C5)-methyltransferase
MASCPHFPACVGCPYAGVPYPEQLRRKERALADALAGEPALAGHAAEPIFGSPRALGYRNQAKLVFRARRRRGSPRPEVVLGVYRPGTHSVVPAERCPVHVPALRPILAGLRSLDEELEIPIFDERTREGSLRYALARWSGLTRQVQLTIVSAAPRPPRLERLVASLRRAHRELGAAFLCVNPTPGNTILSPDVRRLFGPPALAERYGSVVLEARPDAFLQANTAVAASLYATAVKWLAPRREDTALDLYCGTGALALHLAARAGRVVGIESAPAAVASARANAARLRVPHAVFAAGDAAEVESIARQAGCTTPSLVAVNPPRRGLAAAVVDALARLAPRRIAYVSCDPRTLARDLALFAARGYRTERLRAFDMLPQTPHVEALALLTSGSPGRPSGADSR